MKSPFSSKPHGAKWAALSMADSPYLSGRIGTILDGRRRSIATIGRRRAAVAMAGGVCLAASAGLLHLTVAAALPRIPAFERIPATFARQPTFAPDIHNPNVVLENGRAVKVSDLLWPLESRPHDPRWTADLAQGLSVELIGLSERHNRQKELALEKQHVAWGGIGDPYDGSTTFWRSWEPNGAPLSQQLYDPLASHWSLAPHPESANHTRSLPSDSPGRVIEVNFRLKGGSADVPAVISYVTDSWGVMSAGFYPRDHGNPSAGRMAFCTALLPDAMDTGDVHFQIAAGPAEHKYVIPRRLWTARKDMIGATWLQGAVPRLPRDKVPVTVSTPVRFKDGYQFQVSDSVADQECQIFVVDRKGVRYPCNASGMSTGIFRQSDQVFMDATVPLENIDHLEFDTRSYREVVFRNVALYPGRRVP